MGCSFYTEQMSDGGDVVSSERRVGVSYLSPNAPFVLCLWNRAEALELPPVPRLSPTPPFPLCNSPSTPYTSRSKFKLDKN